MSGEGVGPGGLDQVRGFGRRGPASPAGEEFRPWVPARESPREFTIKAVLLGIAFGILFGAANAYLGLVAGLTISTSIPVAVMTVAAFRALRGAGVSGTILEANTSQTVGSASSSVASGVIFTLPALFLWGLPPSLLQMTLLALCGGILGVLFMIPLRRALIVNEHGNLPYPEGTACAEVLVASEVGGGRARNVFLGLGVGAGFKLLVDALKLFPGVVHARIPFLPKAEVAGRVSGALFGVGYILGPRIAAVMVGGGVLSWLVIIPAIAMWGADRATPLYPETLLPIAQMAPDLLWERYVRYIGAGAVAMAGIVTLVRSLPTMVQSFRLGARQIRERMGKGVAALPRTDQDLPLKALGIGILTLVAAMTLVPQVFSALQSPGQRLVAALLVVLCAFFFVTVSSRIVGLVGVTSNPTSGMTIATLLLASTVFLAVGWVGDMGKAAALTIGCVVAIAASIAGDASQDLKTGFLLGATPRHQQVGEILGVLTSAVFVCATVIWLDGAYGFGTTELPAPQATLMRVVIDGVLEQSLPWGLVAIGAGIALACEVARIPSLPFAVGVYLPLSTMVPVFLGGLLRLAAERTARSPEEAAGRRERGVLLGSGLVGGEGLLGVGVALWVGIAGRAPQGIWVDWAGRLAPLVAVVAFLLLAGWFWRRVVKQGAPPP
ncbi:MAG TPA: oligopeptide transporter, OPT family [Thermoanaerobaculia bacterium]|nr:oligopeptide transporter, OPT family [Thermoanaerobaculia bacterium]